MSQPRPLGPPLPDDPAFGAILRLVAGRNLPEHVVAAIGQRAQVNAQLFTRRGAPQPEFCDHVRDMIAGLSQSLPAGPDATDVMLLVLVYYAGMLGASLAYQMLHGEPVQ